MRINFLTLTLLLCSMLPAYGKGDSHGDKAKALNKKLDALVPKWLATTDSVTYYHLAMDVLQTVVACDREDSHPDNKKRQYLRYREGNQQRVGMVRNKVADAGSFFVRRGNVATAMRAYEAYLNTAGNPLFVGYPDQTGDVAYRASVLTYERGNYAQADRYADMALTDEAVAPKAAEMKVRCMHEQMRTGADSARYVAALQALHHNAPANKEYFRRLINYYSSPGKQPLLRSFLENELKRDTNNVDVLALLGETALKEKRWQDAVALFLRLKTQVGERPECCLNLGIACCGTAVALLQEAKQMPRKERKAANGKVKSMLEAARHELETAQRLDAEEQKVQWSKPLYQVYYLLRDKRAEALKKRFSDNK